MAPLTSLQSVVEGLAEFGKRQAVGLRASFGTRWWSYAQLHRNILYAAHLLRQQGLKPGEKVVLYAANSPEWLACFFGLAWRGLVAVPVDVATPPAEVRRLAVEISASLVIVISDQQTGDLDLKILRLLTLDAPSAYNLDAEELRCPIRPHDPAAVLFTSGTGARPEGVVLTHGNLACQLPRFQFWRPVLRMAPTRLLALSPLSHIQGIMLSACVPLSLGLTILYTADVEPFHLQRTLRSNRVRLIATVPRVLQLLQESMQLTLPDAKPRVLRRRLLGHRFRGVLTGGATLPVARELFWRRCGCIVVQGYGSTETAAFVTINRPVIGRLGSIGRAVHEDSLRIAEDGELLVRGPHLSPGYAAKALPKTEDGFFATGDYVRTDRRGRLYFLGRKPDRIVTSEGFSIDPNIVESALREHPAVRDAVAAPGEQEDAEHVHAVLLLSDRSSTNAAAAVQAANKALLPWQKVRSWSIWPGDDFPRGALRKVKRDVVITAVRSTQVQDACDFYEAAISLEQVLAEPNCAVRMRKLIAFLRAAQPDASELELRAFARRVGLESLEEAELITLFRYDSSRSSRPADTGMRAGPPLTNRTVQAPGWQNSMIGTAFRAIAQPLAFFSLQRSGIRVECEGMDHLQEICGPLMFALEEGERQHPVEYLAVLRALPRHIARRVLLLIGERPFFETYFYRKAEDSWHYRLRVAMLFHVGLPGVLPFVILQSGTMNGLDEASHWMSRGYHPLVTWSRATARLGAETQATIIPVRLSGDRSGWTNAHLRIEFQRPHFTLPFADPDFTHQVVRSTLRDAKVCHA